MISLLDSAKLAGGAFLGALAVYAYVAAVSLPAARSEGRAMERAELEAATTKAIGELTNEADKARVARRLCRERDRVYLNATGGCVERAAE